MNKAEILLVLKRLSIGKLHPQQWSNSFQTTSSLKKHHKTSILRTNMKSFFIDESKFELSNFSWRAYIRRNPQQGLISALNPNVGGKIQECFAYLVAQNQSLLQRQLLLHSAVALHPLRQKSVGRKIHSPVQ